MSILTDTNNYSCPFYRTDKARRACYFYGNPIHVVSKKVKQTAPISNFILKVHDTLTAVDILAPPIFPDNT
jgi:hypothetical protein